MFSQIEEYYRLEKLPHIWCPGCGHGIILGAMTRAIKELGYDQNKTVVVSGIGCSSRASGYLDFNTLHTTHGRALAFSTGIKMARPELKVFVVMGDGDCTAIGGNHFIHAARRNIDLTAIVFNNNIYGMTGGQYSPMTPQAKKATTAPYGTIERSFDLSQLAIASGATFVGRGTAYHAKLLTQLIAKGARNKGFSVVEAISQCPTSYGRKNKPGDPAEMIKLQKQQAVKVSAAARLTEEQMQGKFTIGVLHDTPAPEYTETYEQVIRRAQAKA
ncbi:2-oxoacid:ferredoxin oxidoreductase subunit beta [Metallumcola ferriviriculae]|uniref:2-oxoacid:ferredoxin oxidoreductase subunit beta n=1 Tax=Metallumcola ferriviriculae TaxID=3039180 RepID=A0AAU0UT09_9FIRM|nr:2-oxoacid:ferredoxin oxidoreductase subunit beta [Desulfitibacteraceae bacterium MK1]